MSALDDLKCGSCGFEGPPTDFYDVDYQVETRERRNAGLSGGKFVDEVVTRTPRCSICVARAKAEAAKDGS